MATEQLVFYFFAGAALISALLVATLRNIVRSIFLFFITLFSMAGLFLLTLADFVAITQVVVYVGGVLVLMIFAFLLSNRELLSEQQGAKRTKGWGLHYLPAMLVAVVFFLVLASVVYQAVPDELDWVQQAGSKLLKPSDNTVHYLGINLMTRYLIPFEVVSILLMLALVGAAHLARKEKEV